MDNNESKKSLKSNDKKEANKEANSKMVKEIEDPFGGEKTVTIENINNDSSNVNISESHFVEDDGEDLPDNFFDDFSNNDFMAGLELVDDWNDDVTESSEQISEQNDQIVRERRNDKTPIRIIRDKARYDYRGRRRHSRDNDKSRDYQRRKSRSREPRNRSREPRNRSRDRSREPRDPRDRSREPRHRSREPRMSTRDQKQRARRSPKTNSNLPGGAENPEDNISKMDILEGNSEDRNIDRRRDPEKTKRDIQRDKIRCAKDQEARVFQEQLKVAETGLVPPGTELDVVLKSDKFKGGAAAKENEKKKDEINGKNNKQKEEELKKEKDRVAEKRKGATSPRTRSTRKVHRSPERIHRSPERTHRVERERSYSPKRRRRESRSHERERRIRRNSRDFDLRYRIREKRERFLNQLSPVSDNRMSRSPPSDFVMSPEPERETLREKVIRTHNKHNRNRYSRSCSPISSNSLSDRDRGVTPRQRRSKKFSFMEELQIKLCHNPAPNIVPNEMPQNFTMVPPNMMCGPVPNPNPHDFFPQPLMSLSFPPNPQLLMGPGPSMCPPPDPFQHSIMMGSPDPNMLPHIINLSHPPPLIQLPQHLMPPNMQPCLSPFPVPQVPSVPTPPTLFPESNKNMNNSATFRIASNLKDCEVKGNEELEKLFEDKKISLSDFLSVSAKPIDPTTTPVSIHNKIKVISRCQEAIKLLEDPKLTGRFFPKIVNQPIDFEKRANEKSIPNQSPMRKVTVVRFNFTIPANKRGATKLVNQPSASVYLYKIISILGISKRNQVGSAPKSENSPKPVPAPVPAPKPVPPPVPVIRRSNAFIQTEPVKCHKCEIRNAIKFTTRQTQTTETSTVEVSTQVSVEDLNKSCATFIPRGILKNNTSSVQSISHLTPAQLLAQLENQKKEENASKPWSSMLKKETFPIGRGYPDKLPGQLFENNSRTVMGSSNIDRFNDKFNDYRNINPFSDSYTGGESSAGSLSMYGNTNPSQHSIPQDRFSNAYSMKSFGSSTSDTNRNDFKASQNRFGSSMSDPRNFEINPARRFPDSNIGLNFSSWNMPGGGRGNPRGFMGNIPNKFFGQRGPN